MAPAHPALHAGLNNVFSAQIELILLLNLFLCSEYRFQYLRSLPLGFGFEICSTHVHTQYNLALSLGAHPFLNVMLPVTTSCIIGDLDRTVSSSSLVQPYRSSSKRRLLTQSRGAFLLGWPVVKTEIA